MTTKPFYDLPEFNGNVGTANGTSVQKTKESKSPPPYVSSKGYSDPWAKYRAALDYKAHRDFLDLQKNQQLCNQKLAFQESYQQILLNYRNYQALMGCEIYRDASGDLQYAITDPDKKRTMATRLLNVSNYRVRRLTCYYPKAIVALEIIWGNGAGEKKLYWHFTENGSSTSFLKKLKANGILLLVSGRTEKKAGDALLAFSHLSAVEVEIPYDFGWGLNSHEAWHFAWCDELTMVGVLNDV